MKHSLMDYSVPYRKDDRNDEDADVNDDTSFLNIKYCSPQHFDEIMGQSKQEHYAAAAAKAFLRDQQQGMHQPQTLTELLIVWASRIQKFTSKRYRPSGYWRYAIGVYKNLFLMFYFNWFSIVTAPASSLAFVFVYPVISAALFAFEIGLKIFMDVLGGAKLVKRISQDYGHGYSAINWGSPQLLESSTSRDLIRSTLQSLGKQAPKLDTMPDDDHRHRTFDISIAQTMTILSSLVYERHDEKVTEAYKALAEFKTKHDDEDEEAYEHLEMQIKRLVWQSEKPIRKIASTYGLHFAGVTELKSLGGPFCGLYWPKEQVDHPFIIVAFKGTTPTNYSEFLVDATLQRTDARAYLFGSAHEGFYDSLFPTRMDAGNDSRDPYYAIQTAVREKASQMAHSSGRPVQVWVTGHSLGAAMGALLFARWLKCPEDLAPLCELRDAYVIGTPAVGDNDFASLFASYSNIPLSRSSTLWRVINKSDMICRIPPGYNSATIGHYIPSTDFFNYSHVGHAVQITHPLLDSKPLRIYPSSYQSNLKVDIVVSSKAVPKKEEDISAAQRDVSKVDTNAYPWWIRPLVKSLGNPIPIIEDFYPFFLRDHIPIHYYEGLERARGYHLAKHVLSVQNGEHRS